jgi:hypothetical protein
MDFIPLVIFLMYHDRRAVLSGGPLWLRCARGVVHRFIVSGKICRIAPELGLPSLIRFLLMVAFLAGLVYAGMVALATFVTPVPHEIVQTVPPARLNQ